LENSGKNLTFAGQLFLKLMEGENSPSVQLWEAHQAAYLLEQSVVADPSNEDTKLSLATAYIEGVGEPMKGVAILRDITKEKPDDIRANVLLGRMSLQSGQNDKAVKRFETVIKQEPGNSEAIFFLAQAYEALGDKNKAIEIFLADFEQCGNFGSNTTR
jgi:cytochrome c-type biogenesis protein CcmH/NrfG